MESPSNASRTLDYVQKKNSGGQAYIQGILSFAVFLVSALIVIFVYLPYINDTQAIVKKRVSMQAEVDALQQKYDAISSYNTTDLEEGLTAASRFIPDDIRVAQLAEFINQNAKTFNLKVSRLGINEDRAEVKQSAGTEESVKLLGSVVDARKIFLGRVEGPFAFTGARQDIYRFLDFLVMGGYATNFDQVTLNAGEGDWAVSFFASYYYLEPVKNVEASRPFVEIQKDALKPITVENATPSVTATPTVTVTVKP